MLAKKFHLTTEAFRLHARQKSQHAARSALFVIKSYPPTAPHPRFGVVVGKSVDARSTARNRVKRRMHDALGSVMSALPPADYVLIMQPGSRQKTNKELQTELRKILDSRF